MTKAEEVLALERRALDRWGKGDPGGCLKICAPDVTYFDPAVPKRIDGLNALEQYYALVAGKISIDHFEYLNTDVRVNGDVAILTYNLVSHGRGAEGAPTVGTRWNVTEVYEHLSGDWKIVHSHFSYTERP